MKATINGNFFGDIPVVLHKKTTFNACYLKLLEYLSSHYIAHPLPDTLSWKHESLNPDSFIYLDKYTIKTAAKEWSINGHILQHEPYHNPGQYITNYLQVIFTSERGRTFEFLFTFYDGDVPANLKNASAYYDVTIPEEYQSDYIAYINPSAGD